MFAGACSSGDKPDPAIAAVCRTRDQTQLAVNASATVPVAQYPEIILGLESAIKVAPADIRVDFVTVHDVLKPFVDALVKANGDQTVAAQDPSFQQIVAAVSTKKATAAGVRVRKYYAKHC